MLPLATARKPVPPEASSVRETAAGVLLYDKVDETRPPPFPFHTVNPATLGRIASFVRRHPIAGIDRLLRKVCPPGLAERHRLETIIEYDEQLRIHVDTASLIEWTILFHGYYERELDDLLRRLLRPGHTAIDVGANIGAHALVMARAVGDSGRVLALEPHPQVRERLARNIELNRLRQVTLLPCGLSNAPGAATLFSAPGSYVNQGLGSLHAQPELTLESTITLRTLDDVAASEGLSRIDLIKIDTEGHEQKVLEGGLGCLSRYAPHVAFEYDAFAWNRAGVPFQSCVELLGGIGYTLHHLRGNGTLVPLEAASLPSSGNLLAIPPPRRSAQ